MFHRSKSMPLFFVVLATLAIVQFSIGFTSSPSYEWFDPLIDVRGVLVEQHLQSPDEDAMQEAAIRAMVESLDDPYALFIPDEKEEAFIKDLEGDYAGIGAEVRMTDGKLTIITPMDQSPALKAGIQAGDTVNMIDGEIAEDVTIEALIERLVGPVGTDVVIDVKHADGTEETVTVTRGHIQSPSIAGLIRKDQNWSWCLDDDAGIAYIKIKQFNDTTPQELIDALQIANQDAPLQGLVLDLRENPGGSLSAAITIVNMFLSEGTIVTVKGRSEAKRSWNAEEDTMLGDIPMIVLVNQSSASASEIVAGSLQANNRAAILGSRTFGKGSVQQVLKLASGGMLKFTTARYDLSNGRTIDKKLSSDTGLWGVDPNEGLVVRETIDERIERIKNREPFIVITEHEPEAFACGDITWIEDTLVDRPLAKALIAMRAYKMSGAWPVLSEDDPVLVGIQEEVTVLAKRRVEILKTLFEVDEELTSLQAELDEEDASTLPTDAELEEASITLHDKDGNVIGTWLVKNGDIEAALDSLQLEAIEQ